MSFRYLESKLSLLVFSLSICVHCFKCYENGFSHSGMSQVVTEIAKKIILFVTGFKVTTIIKKTIKNLMSQRAALTRRILVEKKALSFIQTYM